MICRWCQVGQSSLQIRHRLRRGVSTQITGVSATPRSNESVGGSYRGSSAPLTRGRGRFWKRAFDVAGEQVRFSTRSVSNQHDLLQEVIFPVHLYANLLILPPMPQFWDGPHYLRKYYAPSSFSR